mgnify:CR=1 FL=1
MNNYSDQILYKDDSEKETICDGYVGNETGEIFYS